MKLLLRVLMATTAIFAVTTAGLAIALMRERTRLTIAPPPGAEQQSTALRAVPEPAQAAGAPASSAAPADAGALCPDPQRIAAARERLQQYAADPVRQQKREADTRTALLTSWGEIAQAIQMPAGQIEPVVERVAAQAIRASLERLECQAAATCPPCDFKALEAVLAQRRRQVIDEALGPVLQQRYAAYLYAIPERTYMQTLRAKLGARDQMEDAPAERLVLALADARRQFIEEVERQGRKVQVTLISVHDYDGDQPPKPFTAFNDALTKTFNERLRRIATQHLAPAQLDAFVAMQEEHVANARLMDQLAR